MSLFTFDNVNVKKGNSEIFKNISFSVGKNKCFIITGDNGTGKSTLLRLFNRLEILNEGTIQYLGKNIKNIDISTLRQDIAMVMQGPVLPDGTVVSFFKLIQQTLNIKLDIEKAVNSVGLKNDILTKNTSSLSGGETQLIALSVVLAKKPKVLLLDEITAALSPQMTEIVRNKIQEQIEKGISVIMVSHRKSEIATLGQVGIFLNNGTANYFSDMENLLKKLETN